MWPPLLLLRKTLILDEFHTLYSRLSVLLAVHFPANVNTRFVLLSLHGVQSSYNHFLTLLAKYNYWPWPWPCIVFYLQALEVGYNYYVTLLHADIFLPNVCRHVQPVSSPNYMTHIAVVTIFVNVLLLHPATWDMSGDWIPFTSQRSKRISNCILSFLAMWYQNCCKPLNTKGDLSWSRVKIFLKLLRT